MDVSEPEIDFSQYEGSGNPFLERLARGAKMPDPPKPWWRILLAYTEAGDLDWGDVGRRSCWCPAT